MTTEDCKLLTEYLGECLHAPYAHSGVFICHRCGERLKSMLPRDFTTPQDAWDVMQETMQKGDAHSFFNFLKLWGSAHIIEPSSTTEKPEYLINIKVLKSPEHFCQLAVDWLKERSKV